MWRGLKLTVITHKGSRSLQLLRSGATSGWRSERWLFYIMQGKDLDMHVTLEMSKMCTNSFIMKCVKLNNHHFNDFWLPVGQKTWYLVDICWIWNRNDLFSIDFGYFVWFLYNLFKCFKMENNIILGYTSINVNSAHFSKPRIMRIFSFMS